MEGGPCTSSNSCGEKSRCIPFYIGYCGGSLLLSHTSVQVCWLTLAFLSLECFEIRDLMCPFLGARPPPICSCREDMCTTNADCPSGSVCAPAGLVGSYFVVNTCIVMGCGNDGDCRAGSNGRCLGVFSGDCPTFVAFECLYSEMPCDPYNPSASPCEPFHICLWDFQTNSTKCVPNYPRP
jgi:hypothetical protein